MRYRSDIDGLRAIAISPVVLLHAGIPGFSGGFVGVDIFFVISGFLITALNLGHVGNGTFSLIDFYDRRIRRIFPALIAVYIFCLILGLLLSLPIDLKEFAKSLTSSAVFVSNMHFYQLAGYFDAPSLSKPLLHSWSLSVEEQFYILWPIAMIALWRFAKPSRRVTIMAIAIAVSLAYAEWEIRRGNQSAAFYLLPARVWELLAGALLAIVIPHLRIGQRLAEIAALGGFALIVGAVVGLSEQRDFPGLNAVIPCAGAVLLNLAGHDRSTAVTRIISSGANASARVLERALRTLVGGLVANGKQVLLIGQVPPYLRTPMNCVAKAVHHESDVSRCFVQLSQVLQQLDFSNGLLRRLAAESDAVHAFLPTDILCDGKSCSPLLNGVFLYRDESHLNTVGAREFAEHFARIPVFSQLRGTPLAKSSAVEAR